MKTHIIDMMDLSRIRDRENNPKIHPEPQLKQLMRSLSAHGAYNPALVDENDVLIAGHGRVAAARRLGWPRFPCIVLRGLTGAQKLALMLADNKIAQNASTDRGKLAVVLKEIIGIDVDFPLVDTGYNEIEIDQILIEDKPQDRGNPADDRIPAIREDEPVVTQAGDLWICGSHAIFCGSALLRPSYERLLGSSAAELIVTDPPYNMESRTIGSSGKTVHADFAMAAGEMSEGEFETFLYTAFDLMAQFSRDGSIHFVCMDFRHLREVLEAGRRAYSELKNIIVWVKKNGGMGTFYRSRHEFVLAFKSGKAPHINNFGLGQHGRYRTNVWEYEGLNSGGKARQEQLKLHPTVKPVRMLADAMLDCSRRGGLVLDPFGGSGSTMIAAERTGRRARLIELEPRYVDCTIRRWQDITRDDAVHAETGETYNERLHRLKRARVCWIPEPDRPHVRRVDFAKAVMP